MSVQKRGARYIVRWREGGHQRSRSFILKGDADAFDLEVKRRRQLGPIASGVMQSRMTLAQFVVEDWWPRYAIPNLKSGTQRRYMETWGAHLLHQLGDYELRELTPLMIEDFLATMRGTGKSPQAQRRVLMLLQGILRRAVVRGLLPANPVQFVEKPKQAVAARPEPLSPSMIERIRSFMGMRDATLVSVLGYAGLRPGEATAMRWKDIRGNSLYVLASKTDRPRTVRLLAPLVQDLAEWRMASGRPPDHALVFPMDNGKEWSRAKWGNWRVHHWHGDWKGDPGPIVKAGITGDTRVYRLRGSFVSLLLAEGRTLIYVASQAGHSVATLARHYAGVIREYEDLPKIDAEQAIRDARTAVVERKVRETM